jgi:hypothetical protein
MLSSHKSTGRPNFTLPATDTNKPAYPDLLVQVTSGAATTRYHLDLDNPATITPAPTSPLTPGTIGWMIEALNKSKQLPTGVTALLREGRVVLRAAFMN